MLNSIAVIDENRKRMALGSLIGAFGGLPGGLSSSKTGKSILVPTAPMTEAELSLEQLLSYIDNDVATAADIRVEKVKKEDIITVNAKVLFNKDRSKLNPSLSPLLDKLCNFINKGDYQVEIVGHTDDIQAQEKGYESNWELSTLMAIQVLKYFCSEGAVLSRRLTAYGCGSYKPIAPNDTKQLRTQNMRVDIILKYKVPDYIKKIFRKRPSGFFTYKKYDFKIF